MKKTVKILALALVAVMAVAMLVACGPASNPDKAAKALEKNGYTVTKITNESKAGEMTLNTQAKFMGLEDGDIVATVSAMNEDKEFITITYFASSSAAKKAWDKSQEAKGDDEEDSEIVTKLSGKMIYAGTKKAIKAAK